MVLMVRNDEGAGDRFEANLYPRHEGPRYWPGAATKTMIPNRHAHVTVEVGPPMVPIGVVAGHQGSHYLEGSGFPGGEVVMGTDIVVGSRANDEWLRGAVIPSRGGPILLANNPEYGRGVADSHSGVVVPRWYPEFPGDVPVEDRSL